MKSNKEEESVVKSEFKQLGTEIEFRLVVGDNLRQAAAKKDLAKAKKMCEKFERIFSRFDLESEIFQLNKSLGKKFQASPTLIEVARLAIEAYDETEGYFDPRIIETLEGIGYDRDFSQVLSGQNLKINIADNFKRDLRDDLVIAEDEVVFNCRMDFAGIAKGFIVDKLAEFFRTQGWENFLVDCGGDMFFSGKDEKSNLWYVDIEGVEFESLMLQLSGQGIATSGIGKRKWEIGGGRFHHLVNPKAPENFSFDLKSVTVVDKLTSRADVLAKVIFLMGKEKGIEFAKKMKVPCAILDYKGGVWISSEIKKYLYSPC